MRILSHRLSVLSLSLSLPICLGFTATGSFVSRLPAASSLLQSKGVHTLVGSSGPLPELAGSLLLHRSSAAAAAAAGGCQTRNNRHHIPTLGTRGGRQRRGFGGMPVLKMGAVTEGQDLKELFDVYEAPGEEFKKTGVPKKMGHNKERGRVHADGDWHRAVHIWLYTPQGEFVLQKRSDKKDTFPLKWDVSVGGHITSGDDVMFTAIKETEEELGVEVAQTDLQFLATIHTSLKGNSPKQGDFTCNEYKDVFLLEYKGTLDGLNFADNEVADVKLVHWTEVEKDMLAQIGPGGEELDGPYVPRPMSYVDLLFGAMRERFGK